MEKCDKSHWMHLIECFSFLSSKYQFTIIILAIRSGNRYNNRINIYVHVQCPSIFTGLFNEVNKSEIIFSWWQKWKSISVKVATEYHNIKHSRRINRSVDYTSVWRHCHQINTCSWQNQLLYDKKWRKAVRVLLLFHPVVTEHSRQNTHVRVYKCTEPISW